MSMSGLQVATYINLGAMNVDPLAPTWTLLRCIRNETLDSSPEKIETNCRNAYGWKTALAGLRAGTVSSTYLFTKGDVALDKVRSDMLTGAPSQYAFMFAEASPSQAVVGDEGFVSPMVVTGYEVTRNYDAAVEVALTLDPYFDPNVPPQWWIKA